MHCAWYFSHSFNQEESWNTRNFRSALPLPFSQISKFKPNDLYLCRYWTQWAPSSVRQSAWKKWATCTSWSGLWTDSKESSSSLKTKLLTTLQEERFGHSVRTGSSCSRGMASKAQNLSRRYCLLLSCKNSSVLKKYGRKVLRQLTRFCENLWRKMKRTVEEFSHFLKSGPNQGILQYPGRFEFIKTSFGLSLQRCTDI